MDNLLSWMEQYINVGSTTPAAAAAGSSIHRTCRFASCIEPTGSDIDPSSKYVSLRCNKGCASTFHVGCYYEISLTFVEKEDGSISCWHAEDERKCEGFFACALLKHQGKFVSHLMKTSIGEPNEDKSMYDDPQADDNEDVRIKKEFESASEKTDSAQSNLPSSAGARFWNRSMARQFGRIVVTGGAIMFKDELAKIDMQQTKAEKKKREEEQAAVKVERKKREEEQAAAKTVRKQSQAQVLNETTYGVSKSTVLAPPMKILNGFEVVIPMSNRSIKEKSCKSITAEESQPSAIVCKDKSKVGSVNEQEEVTLNGISVKQQIDADMALAFAESKASEKRRLDQERAQRKQEKRIQKKIEKQPEGGTREIHVANGCLDSAMTREPFGLAALIRSLTSSSPSISSSRSSARSSPSDLLSCCATNTTSEGDTSSPISSAPVSSDAHHSPPSLPANRAISSVASYSALTPPETDGFPIIAAELTSYLESPLAASSNGIGVIAITALPIPLNSRSTSTSSSSSALVQSVPVPSASLHQPAPLLNPVSVTPPSYQLVDGIAECSFGSRSSIVLIHNLPLDISMQMVGGIFCAFGKWKVHFVLTKQHGLTGVIQYLINEDHATQAIATLSHRIYQYTTMVNNKEMHTGEMNTKVKGIELWKIGQLVYATKPLQMKPIAAPSQLKLIS